MKAMRFTTWWDHLEILPHIENFGTVICAGGGVGVAPMLPIIKALKAAGNRVLSVIAG